MCCACCAMDFSVGNRLRTAKQVCPLNEFTGHMLHVLHCWKTYNTHEYARATRQRDPPGRLSYVSMVFPQEESWLTYMAVYYQVILKASADEGRTIVLEYMEKNNFKTTCKWCNACSKKNKSPALCSDRRTAPGFPDSQSGDQGPRIWTAACARRRAQLHVQLYGIHDSNMSTCTCKSDTNVKHSFISDRHL